MANATFTPRADVFEELKDGRGKKRVATKGVPIAWEAARMLGLVEGDAPAVEDTPFVADPISDAKPKRA